MLSFARGDNGVCYCITWPFAYLVKVSPDGKVGEPCQPPSAARVDTRRTCPLGFPRIAKSTGTLLS